MRTRYLVRRVLAAVMTVVVALTLNFLLFRAVPGSAVSDLSRVPGATPALRHQLAAQFGLDKPKWEQYLVYLKQLAHGNLGVSYDNHRPVVDDLAGAMANTAPMVALGVIVAVLLGIATGVLSAWRRGGPLDHLSTGSAIAFLSVPAHWLGLMLIIAFAGILPTGGRTDDFLVDPTLLQHLGDVLAHMVLPSLTLALSLYGGFTLIVRSAMIETLGEDHVLTARAKGLSDAAVLRGHVLRNAMLPIATVITLSLAFLVTGAILVEIVFSWPGVGRAIYEAVLDRDYPMLQGAFLALTLSVVVLNFLADLLYVRLDPRVAA